MAYDAKFAGGVSIASGDVNNDGTADIVTAAGAGGGPHIRVFSGSTGAEIFGYMAYDVNFTGGVSVAVADVDGDHRADIVTGSGPGMAPQVRIASGATGTVVRLSEFFAYDTAFVGGVRVAAGDANGDGRAEIITGAGPGGGPHVRIFDGQSLTEIKGFMAFDPQSTQGVRVSSAHLNSDGLADLLVTQGNKVRGFAGKTLTEISNVQGNIVGSQTAAAVVAASATKDGNAILGANAFALNAIRASSLPPPRASRLLAMVHLAAWNAVKAAQSTPVAVGVATPSDVAAAAAAAHRILTAELPAMTASFDAYRDAAFALVTDSAGRDAGAAIGIAQADIIHSGRQTDGSQIPVTYTPGTNPGEWQKTPPALADALLPNWGHVIPFVISSGDQFRPNSFPGLSSVEYATEFNEVKVFGKSDSATRTADQTQIALFWADGAGTVTPPGHWNQIARDQSLLRGMDLLATAELFAKLNMAMADAAIAAWDVKYASNNGLGYWRPVTAIRQADLDGNAATAADPSWSPLITTPPFPTYVSGHSTFSAAAATVLASMLGDTTFYTYSDALPGVARSFSTFAGASTEAGRSRIYGGIHFESDNRDGAAIGVQIGNLALQLQ
jgi:membrane-associated phospholipid phosphatase